MSVEGDVAAAGGLPVLPVMPVMSVMPVSLAE